MDGVADARGDVGARGVVAPAEAVVGAEVVAELLQRGVDGVEVVRRKGLVVVLLLVAHFLRYAALLFKLLLGELVEGAEGVPDVGRPGLGFGACAVGVVAPPVAQHGGLGGEEVGLEKELGPDEVPAAGLAVRLLEERCVDVEGERERQRASEIEIEAEDGGGLVSAQANTVDGVHQGDACVEGLRERHVERVEHAEGAHVVAVDAPGVEAESRFNANGMDEGRARDATRDEVAVGREEGKDCVERMPVGQAHARLAAPVVRPGVEVPDGERGVLRSAGGAREGDKAEGDAVASRRPVDALAHGEEGDELATAGGGLQEVGDDVAVFVGEFESRDRRAVDARLADGVAGGEDVVDDGREAVRHVGVETLPHVAGSRPGKRLDGEFVRVGGRCEERRGEHGELPAGRLPVVVYTDEKALPFERMRNEARRRGRARRPGVGFSVFGLRALDFGLFRQAWERLLQTVHEERVLLAVEEEGEAEEAPVAVHPGEDVLVRDEEADEVAKAAGRRVVGVEAELVGEARDVVPERLEEFRRVLAEFHGLVEGGEAGGAFPEGHEGRGEDGPAVRAEGFAEFAGELAVDEVRDVVADGGFVVGDVEPGEEDAPEGVAVVGFEQVALGLGIGAGARDDGENRREQALGAIGFAVPCLVGGHLLDNGEVAREGRRPDGGRKHDIVAFGEVLHVGEEGGALLQHGFAELEFKLAVDFGRRGRIGEIERESALGPAEHVDAAQIGGKRGLAGEGGGDVLGVGAECRMDEVGARLAGVDGAFEPGGMAPEVGLAVLERGEEVPTASAEGVEVEERAGKPLLQREFWWKRSGAEPVGGGAENVLEAGHAILTGMPARASSALIPPQV